MAWTSEEAKKVIQQVQAKAAADKAFRQKCLTNPHAAIQEVAGAAVPAGMKLKIVESEPSVDYTIVLPAMQGAALSDKDLDKVAAGHCYKSCTDW